MLSLFPPPGARGGAGDNPQDERVKCRFPTFSALSLRLTDRSEAAPPLTEIKWSKAALLRELNAMLGRR